MSLTTAQLMRLRDIDAERARCISKIILLKKEEDEMLAPIHPPRALAEEKPEPRLTPPTQSDLLHKAERERAARRRASYFQPGRS